MAGYLRPGFLSHIWVRRENIVRLSPDKRWLPNFKRDNCAWCLALTNRLGKRQSAYRLQEFVGSRFPQSRRKIISISAFEFIIQPVAVTLNESINVLACWVIDSDAPTAFTCTKQRFDIFSIKIDCSRNHVFATVSRSERFCRVIHSLDFSRLWTMLI